MNIFIDSNILYDDPFFNSPRNKALVEHMREIDNSILISRVVYEESKSNYVKQVKKELETINKCIRKLRGFKEQLSEFEFDRDTYAGKWDDFYQSLIKDEVVTIIEYDNDFMPELVRRAIDRRKPFKENGQEFRDCIIWLSYAKEAKRKEGESCFFITKNIKDFTDKTGEKIHPELEKDFNGFKFYKLIKDFWEAEKGAFDILKDKAIERKATEGEYDEELISYLHSKYLTEIKNSCNKELQNGNNTFPFWDQSCGMVDSIEFDDTSFEISNVDLHDKEVYNQEVIVTGDIYGIFTADLYQYNGYRDPGEDRYTIYTSEPISFNTSFEISLKPNEKISDYFSIMQTTIEKH